MKLDLSKPEDQLKDFLISAHKYWNLANEPGYEHANVAQLQMGSIFCAAWYLAALIEGVPAAEAAADFQALMTDGPQAVIIEAKQLIDDLANHVAVVEWIRGGGGKAQLSLTGSHVFIFTLEGQMRADIGDWVIRGIQGEFYPCKPDIFDATYEPVLEQLAKAGGPEQTEPGARWPHNCGTCGQSWDMHLIQCPTTGGGSVALTWTTPPQVAAAEGVDRAAAGGEAL